MKTRALNSRVFSLNSLDAKKMLIIGCQTQDDSPNGFEAGRNSLRCVIYATFIL